MDALKVGIIFLMMVLLLWRHFSLNPVVFLATIILMIFYKTSPINMVMIFWRGLINDSTINAITVLIAILFLDNLLEELGYIDRMIEGTSTLFKSSKAVIFALPAFMGMLPTIGGAVLSAPILEKAAQGLNISQENQSFLNYYFWHVMEIFCPLFPSIILAAQIADVSVSSLAISLLPYAVLMIGIGIFYLFKIVPPYPPEKQAQAEEKQPSDKKSAYGKFILSALPIFTVVLAVMLLGTNVFLTCSAMLLVILIIHRPSLSKILIIGKKALKPKIFISIIVVMIFKQALADTNAIAGLAVFLSTVPIPSYIIFSLIAIFIGALTGLKLAAVGIVFPLAMAVVPSPFPLSWTALLMASSYVGMMLSPVHLCTIFNADYFKVEVINLIKKMIIPEAILYVVLLTTFMLITIL